MVRVPIPRIAEGSPAGLTGIQEGRKVLVVAAAPVQHVHVGDFGAVAQKEGCQGLDKINI